MQHPLVKEPEAVALLSKSKDEENWAFRNYLKGKGSKEVDKVVQELNKDVSSQIDCTQCGNCCKTINAAFTSDEAEITAPHLNISGKSFLAKYCQHHELDDIYYIKNPPCVFLKENKCTVYEKRPASCAEYPHLNKPNFIFRTMSVLENYKICPIVFNVVERLKTHYNFYY